MTTAVFKMDASLASATDVCPICKSTAQTSPNLRFKVSSKCYHRICEGCVDRKFSAGKAQCPVSGCSHMLWKRDWRTQTYEDIQVEREVDIRRRVWNILDLSKLGLVEDATKGWEGVFQDLRSYNDYLETKEEFAMNLIYNTDAAATQKKLGEYQSANGLKKDKDEKSTASKAPLKPGEYPDASGLIKGLKPRYVPKALSPYNPFGDLAQDRGYYSRSDAYEVYNPKEREVKQDFMDMSGYSYEAYMDQNLLSAFAGLGVFVDVEKSEKTDMALPLAAAI